MKDMQEFLGAGAHDGQPLEFWTVFGAAGTGKFTTIAKDRLAATANVKVPFFNGPAQVNLTITGPGSCRIELRAAGTSHVDDKATYKDVNNTREVYCALFPAFFQQISIVLWRDGRYSNIKLWGKNLGIWAQLLHSWAHPTAAEAGVPAALFDAGLEPLYPSIPA
jgi:hypothetical protein